MNRRSSMVVAAGTRPLPLPLTASFRHEMLFYAGGDHGFLEGTLGVVRRALAREAHVLVAVDVARAAALRQALGDEAERVRFADMRKLGRNPARVISVLQELAGEHARGNGALGIHEPVSPGRSPAELDECERHEALLNFAFDDGPGWHLLCPYDLDGLDDRVLEAAQRCHPVLSRDGASTRNETYTGRLEPAQPFVGALPAPSGSVAQCAFTGSENLSALRHLISAWAARESLGVERGEELVLAVDELATNSIRHGGGAGTLRFWREADTLLCEVQDEGRFKSPLVGRTRPSPEAQSGRGVWLVNQLCDLVQIRSGPAGSVVRVHMRLT
jgi:anti-sigma regulatory factor (Ser/Thr protein kinase)